MADVGGGWMSVGSPESDPLGALREFCADLKKLRRSAGGPTVESLAKNPAIPLGRAHIYATLGGKISRPPNWRFVDAFVRRCVEYATEHGVNLGTAADAKEWEHRYRILLHTWDQQDRNRKPCLRESPRVHHGKSTGQPLTIQEIEYYPVPTIHGDSNRRIGIITGDMRQIRCADVWVNSENTEMEMARVHDFSISAIIRYEGARHDARGRVAEDIIANELEARVADQRPLEPGAVAVTGAGELGRRNGVRHIIHVAAVHGEPGCGFRPVAEIGRCVTNVLREAEHLNPLDDEVVTVLFPLLGTGSAGGDLPKTATLLIHAARNYLYAAAAVSRIETVYFLAYTDLELEACRSSLRSADLRRED